ncbi:MAG TPA: tryptophan synthase subunit alpha [Acidobacteria bacterium]|nr:tryptophan synthase subunit alpha [Acidobacteriota bacterium]
MKGAEALSAALSAAARPALVAYLTAGFPSLDAFAPALRATAARAAVLEVGVPFSDPMADGATIQRASRIALEAGASLTWILDTLAAAAPLAAPVVLMSYLNPLLAGGLERNVRRAAEAGVAGMIVPDLPLEEAGPLGGMLEGQGMALVQLVTPVTAPPRIERLARASRGFLYAVTTAGITGGEVAIAPALRAYLARVREVARLPVCAGFGIRSAAQVAALADVVDGVIVGSALVEALERGEDPGAFLEALVVGGDEEGR